MSTRGLGVLWVWYHADSILIIFTQPWYVLVCSMLSVFMLLIFIFNAFVGWWDFMLWYSWLNHFLVLDQFYLIFSLVSLRGMGCFEWFFLDDVMLWHVWLDHFGVFDQYYFECFLVAHWKLIDIVIYHLMLFSCLWRIDVNIGDCLLMLFSFLYRVEVILWFVISWAWGR